MKLVYYIFVFIIFCQTTLFGQAGASSCAQLALDTDSYQTCASNISFTSSNIPSNENFSPTCFQGSSLVAPSWFIFKIENPGPITLQISQRDSSTGQGIDVDFALFGPFTDLTNLCDKIINANEVDCSYSGLAIENVNVPNSATGTFYVIVIDNFAALQGQSGPIKVTQIGGSGSTDCDFLSSVKIKNTDASALTQLEYCNPDTKDITAFVDNSTFGGNVANLRYNYTWYKDNVQIGVPILNTTASSNTITTSQTGDYKVIITSYDVVNNPNQISPVPLPNQDIVSLKFHEKPSVIIQHSNTVCLDTNPVLSATVTNTSSLNPTVDILSYQWFRNTVAISGATQLNYTPNLPGDYFVRVTNSPCSISDSNIIRIIANPLVSILDATTICEGSNYTITSTNSNAAINSSLTYEWFKDGVSTGITTPNYVVNASNQALNTTSVYYVETKEQGLCAHISNSVSITVTALPIINTTPVVLEQCDFISPTTDGVAETNLLQRYDELTNNTAGLTLYFYEDAALTQLIPNPNQYVNSTLPFARSIYVKAVNENLTPACTSLGTGRIDLIINPTSLATYPNTSPVCVEVNQNYGLVDFDAQRILIKNTFFPSSPVDISFYLTPSDASLENNPLTSTSQLPIGTNLIYTRIETNDNCGGIGTFDAVVLAPPLYSVVSNEDLCLAESFLLSSKDAEALLNQNATVVASYFASFTDAVNAANEIDKNSSLPLVLGSKVYYVRLYDTSSQCVSVVNFTITTFSNPVIFAPTPIKKCGSGSVSFNLESRKNQITGGNTNYQVFFYATPTDLASGNAILNTTNHISTSTTISVKVVDAINNNCESYTTLNLQVIGDPGSTISPTPLEICNDSGFDFFNLKSREIEMAGTDPVSSINFKYYEKLQDAQLNNSNLILIPSSFKNTSANFQKIYVRLNSITNVDSETNLSCYRILELDLFVRPFPANNLLKRPYTICVDQLQNITYPVEIKTLLPSSDYAFVWFTGSDANVGNEIAGEVNNSFVTAIVGNYSVKITNTTNPALCTVVYNFSTQNSLVPNSLQANPTTLIAFDSNQTIIASVLPNSSDYLYSVDGSYWQESNTLTNIPTDATTLYVTNKFGCGETLTLPIIVVDFPKFFTPNGDGFHDYWNIEGANGIDIESIFIFDKYGKLIKQIDPNSSSGWDGTFNGKLLPSTDYWFKMIYTSNGNKQEFKSHFSLVR